MKFKSNAKYGQPVESGSVYEGRIGNIIISVHHIYGGKEWYLSCHSLNISQRELKSEGLISAINEAKEILKKKVEDLQKDINAFCEENIEISRY